ncbi:MAG TPA: hypothetical protein H9896_07005 [Candidatus Pygmaiobacter gallistercoris]|nr:hypothetical protein [Candidatus Pygmaiobacter gallistercoris]
MTAFWALMKVSFRGLLLSANPSSKAKKKAASGIGVLILMSALMLYLGGFYSFMFGSLLAPIGRLDLLVLIMGVMAVALCFFFGIMGSAGFVFGGKDNDLLLALPVPVTTVLLSKVLALYLENLIFTLFLLLPATAACLYYGGFGAIFLPFLPFGLLLLPLLPSALCLVVGFVFSLIQSRVRHRALVNNLLYIIFLAAIMYLSMRMSFTTSSGDTAGALAIGPALRWALPAVWLSRALCARSLTALLAFIAGCVLPFAVIILLFSRFYKKILTRLSAVHLRQDYKLAEVKTAGPLAALYGKEIRRIFGTPVYLMNSGIGSLMLLGGGIYAFFKGDAAALLFGTLPGGSDILTGLLALVVGFCVLLCSTTSASISLEGSRLWILLEAPVPVHTIFAAKLLAGLTLSLPPVLIGIPLGAIGCGQDPLAVFTLTLLGIAAGCFAVLEGLVLNLLWPKLDAVNDTVIVKNSMSVMVQVFGSFGLLAAGAGLFVLLSGKVGAVGVLLLLAGLLALFCLLFAVLLRGWGRRAFSRLCS